MRRFQEGDEDAFRLLFDRYAPRLVNFCARYQGSLEEGEDLAQEALVRLYHHRDRYDARRPFKPWLFTIAARLCANRYRDQRRHRIVSLFAPPKEGEDQPALIDRLEDFSAPSPEDASERKEFLKLVESRLAELPDEQRAALLLLHAEQMSYEEIAAALESSVGAVKSLIFRARKQLAQYFSVTFPLTRGTEGRRERKNTGEKV